MPRKSKREIERDLQTLDDTDDAAEVGIYVFERENHVETRTDAARPDLTIPDDVRGGYETATPTYVTPEEYPGPILFVTPSVVETWPERTGDDAVPIPELWDSLTGEQLREERRRREANDDPIPPVLEDYA